jgi:hypothetical protein
MAPIWFNLLGKQWKSTDQSSPTQNHDSLEQELNVVDQNWSPNQAVAAQDRGVASSSCLSMSTEGSQLILRHVPTGFEQFSPPLYQRRVPTRRPTLTSIQSQDSEDEKGHYKSDETMDETLKEDELKVELKEDNSTEDRVNNGKEGPWEKRGKQVAMPYLETYSAPRLDPHHADLDHPSDYSTSIRSDSTAAVLARLPHGGEEGKTYDRRRTIHTMITIVGGWCALIVACFGFKMMAVRVSSL